MSTRIPKYRLHKGTGQALVEIDGKRIYLGRHGTEESQRRYRRIIAEWLGRTEASGPRPGEHLDTACRLSINELVLAYWKFVTGYYVKDGEPTSEQTSIRYALRALRHLYGETRAADFGPKDLKLVRQSLIDRQLSRRYINDTIGRLKRMFRWAVSEELLPPNVYEAVRTVDGLRRGRSQAREPERIEPVSDTDIEATLPFLPPVVADIVRFQRLVGCRPGEACAIRPGDVDRSCDVWEYRPQAHKTERFGHDRVIFIGPQAQAVLAPYLDRGPDEYCFSPAESEQRRHASRRVRADAIRRVRASENGRQRALGPQYEKDSYRVAIARACRRAGVPHWTPNRLRHARATMIRQRFGLEAAQVVLGHSHADVTQIYAERDYRLAAEVAAQVG